ncbi:hypothetical protein CcCBS67573_g04567 [Chytriomyces confervae]|uniref:SAM domain-containing protein n=1 Tax=Chytriomyces confervae TaxID=246404 RepID=A0A507FDD8_9FUNG|nr:hypothetical protein HDU80_011585 [Chytriomyces hyalinus]TPX74152.1 hypothetical protein CcCBS67573_g04567 [Chytriomyces confervae]
MHALHALLALLALSAHAVRAQVLTRLPASVLNNDATCTAAVNAALQKFYDCGFRITTASTTVDPSTTDVAASLCICEASTLNLINAMTPSCAAVPSSSSFIEPIASIKQSCSILSSVGGSTTTGTGSSGSGSSGTGSSGSGSSSSGSSGSGSSSSGSSNSQSDGGSKTGLIGGVIGGVVGIAVIGAIIYFYNKSKQQKSATPYTLDSQPMQPPHHQPPPQQQQQQQYVQQQQQYGQQQQQQQYYAQPQQLNPNVPPAGFNNTAPAGPTYAAIGAPQVAYAQSSVGDTYSSSRTTAYAPSIISASLPAVPAQEKQSQLFPQQLQQPQNNIANLMSAKQLESFAETTFDVREAELWSAGQTVAWLKSLQYPQPVLMSFSNNNCDGHLLKAIGKNVDSCKEALKSDFGITDVRTRTLLADSICALFEKQSHGYGASSGEQLPPGYTEF